MTNDPFFVGPASAPDKYKLSQCLGAGGEGEVWTAELRLSEQGRRQVAVKILRDDRIGRDDASWERHADLLRSVGHPGLVRVLEVFTGCRKHRLTERPTALFRYVVMDLVHGETLRDWLSENPNTTLTHRFRVLNNVAAALDEMHSGDQTVVPIAHGDVKPGNIVIQGDGSTVLVDLGLMRISDGTVVAGATVPYAAPELFRPGAMTTPEADRFAFAATVVHTILGEPPPVSVSAPGPDLDAIAERLRVHPLSARRPHLQRHVMQALTVPPEQRPECLSRWLSMLIDNLSQTTTETDAFRDSATRRKSLTTSSSRAPGSSHTQTTAFGNQVRTSSERIAATTRPTAIQRFGWLPLLAAIVAASAVATAIGFAINAIESPRDSGGAAAGAGGRPTATASVYGPTPTTTVTLTPSPAVRSEVQTGAIPAGYMGRWTGIMTQPNSPKSPYSMEAELRQGGLGEHVGTSGYSTLGCGGDLTLLAVEGARLILREDISYGKSECVITGYYEVRLAGSGKLYFAYHGRPDLYDAPTSWATLANA